MDRAPKPKPKLGSFRCTDATFLAAAARLGKFRSLSHLNTPTLVFFNNTKPVPNYYFYVIIRRQVGNGWNRMAWNFQFLHHLIHLKHTHSAPIQPNQKSHTHPLPNKTQTQSIIPTQHHQHKHNTPTHPAHTATKKGHFMTELPSLAPTPHRTSHHPPIHPMTRRKRRPNPRHPNGPPASLVRDYVM